MPHVGQLEIASESWTNIVTGFMPNLVVGTKYRITHLSIRGGEMIRQMADPGDALKGKGVPSDGVREIVTEAGIGIWIRSFGAGIDGYVVVETA